MENNPESFQREMALLYKTISGLNKNTTLVYFSTFNVFDPSLVENSYVKHKVKIEKWLEAIPNAVVVRIPVVIADSPNPNTLINFFTNAILDGREVKVFSNAFRYILGIHDFISQMNEGLLLLAKADKVINLAYPVPISVQDIFCCIEEILNVKGNKKILNEGQNYSVDKVVFPFGSQDFLDPVKYLKNNLQILKWHRKIQLKG